MRLAARASARSRPGSAPPLGHLVLRPALHRLIAAGAAALALAGCGGSAAPAPQSVAFGGIKAFLVLPRGKGPHPAVVLVHGSGGNRRELLPEAVLLAKSGLVALTLTAPSSVRRPAPPTTLSALLAQARREQEGDVAAVRAAAAFLARRGDVDPRRLGYLGWSAGAKTGTFVTGRFRALALLSAGADTVERFVAAAPPAARAEVRRALTPIDPIEAIAHGKPGTILLEDGRRDAVVPRPALLNVVRAAPRGTTVRWYDAGHALDRRAWAEARAWLASRLGA